MSNNLADFFLPSHQCDRQIFHCLAISHCGGLSKCLIVGGPLALSRKVNDVAFRFYCLPSNFRQIATRSGEHRDAYWNQTRMCNTCCVRNCISDKCCMSASDNESNYGRCVD